MHGNLSSDRELLRFIEAAGESDNIDHKGPMTWEGTDRAKLAKHIAAFSNSRDGGAIVVGKSGVKGAFEYTGLSDEQLESFDTTQVAGWVNSHFEPPIRLTCNPVENDGRKFIVINIAEFQEFPAVCVKGFDDPSGKGSLLRDRIIYVRGPNAESVPLGTPDQVRELIGIAVKKRVDELSSLFHAMTLGRPLVPEPSNDDRFDEELDRMIPVVQQDAEQAIEAGGWRMIFHPAIYDKSLIQDNEELERIIARNSARVVDEFPPHQVETKRYMWGIANRVYGEPWGLSKSGQFYACMPFRENGYEWTSPWTPTSGEPYPSVPAGQWINYLPAITTLVQFFLFVARLGPALKQTGVVIKIRAGSLQGRKLLTTNRRLMVPDHRFAEPADEEWFDWERRIDANELSSNWREECADAAAAFVDLFGGRHVSRDGVRGWVDAIMNRSIYE